jgi:hypothetical protein
VQQYQLLRGACEIDHLVKLGCAIARTPREAQHSAVTTREAEARAPPDDGAEVEISPSEPETLLRDGKALAEPPSIGISHAGAVPNGHSQAEVLRLVGAPNGLEERVEPLREGPGEEPEIAEAVQDPAQDTRVAAPCRRLPSFSEKAGCLVLRIARTSEVAHDCRKKGVLCSGAPVSDKEPLPQHGA